ncbi:MAG: hypothetical protein M1546_02840 [Chloroflexi bacterium]|nr:hypothetical protein [Chloroflexota bacterium]
MLNGFTISKASMSKLVVRTGMLLAAGVALVLSSAGAGAAGKCRTVSGYFDLHPVTGPACTSSVGVCAEGAFRGDIRGDYASTFSSIVTTADTPTTSVILFTADTTAHARVGSRAGDLIFKESGAYHTTGGDEFVELFSIVGGTGDFAGASGVLSSSGTYDPVTGGEAEYHGNICIP